MGYYVGWRPEKEKVMGLIIEVNTNQELREKMADGSVIKCIREYFEQLREEESLPFGGVEDRISRDNATDYVEVSSHEKCIDYQTFARPRPGKLVEDLRELILLAYDQVFSSGDSLEAESPEEEVEPSEPELLLTLNLEDMLSILDYTGDVFLRNMSYLLFDIHKPSEVRESMCGLIGDREYMIEYDLLGDFGRHFMWVYLNQSVDDVFAVVEYAYLSTDGVKEHVDSRYLSIEWLRKRYMVLEGHSRVIEGVH